MGIQGHLDHGHIETPSRIDVRSLIRLATTIDLPVAAVPDDHPEMRAIRFLFAQRGLDRVTDAIMLLNGVRDILMELGHIPRRPSGVRNPKREARARSGQPAGRECRYEDSKPVWRNRDAWYPIRSSR